MLEKLKHSIYTWTVAAFIAGLLLYFVLHRYGPVENCLQKPCFLLMSNRIKTLEQDRINDQKMMLDIIEKVQRQDAEERKRLRLELNARIDELHGK